MTDIVMPKRKWGDEDEVSAAPPVVLVSSRDGAPVPVVKGAAALARVAERNGWAVRQTYALAAIAAVLYVGDRAGGVRYAAHELASVAVRFARGHGRQGQRGWAIWHRKGEAGWSFACAFIGYVRYAGTGEHSIARALAVTPC